MFIEHELAESRIMNQSIGQQNGWAWSFFSTLKLLGNEVHAQIIRLVPQFRPLILAISLNKQEANRWKSRGSNKTTTTITTKIRFSLDFVSFQNVAISRALPNTKDQCVYWFIVNYFPPHIYSFIFGLTVRFEKSLWLFYQPSEQCVCVCLLIHAQRFKLCSIPDNDFHFSSRLFSRLFVCRLFAHKTQTNISRTKERKLKTYDRIDGLLNELANWNGMREEKKMKTKTKQRCC